MKTTRTSQFFALLLTLTCIACQQRIFGVDEAVWSTLSEEQRTKVIDGYNARKEIELENERHRREIAAHTPAFHSTGDTFSVTWDSSSSEPKVQFFSSTRIQAISSDYGSRALTIGDERFEIPFYSKISDAWLKGQRVELTKNDDSLLYPVKIKNLDNGESVIAKKARG